MEGDKLRVIPRRLQKMGGILYEDDYKSQRGKQRKWLDKMSQNCRYEVKKIVHLSCISFKQLESAVHSYGQVMYILIDFLHSE